MQTFQDLAALGWSNRQLSQLDLTELETLWPARIAEVHRDRVILLCREGPRPALTGGLSSGELAVGDWCLFDAGTASIARLLDRTSRLARRAAGEVSREQLIAANIDTAFLTTSCNADFNPARIERYLALIRAGGVEPVIVLTKADLCPDQGTYQDKLRTIAPGVPALALDSRAPETIAALAPWCGKGRTVCFLGSSGVGKSTLAATMTGQDLATAAIREDDAKGRHTTTGRSLLPIPGDGWLIDTPGMRELRLTDAADGIAATFADIAELAARCRFSDCGHDSEPGCAIRAAIDAGDLDPIRLRRWQKLQREDRWNSASVADVRAASRRFGKLTRNVLEKKRRAWDE